MEQQPIFNSAEDAIRVTWRFIPRLAQLWLWLLIAMAHLAVLVLLLVLTWCFHWTPSALAATYQRISSARPVAVFLAAGGSALGLLAGYWRLVRWAHGASYSGWLFRYLNRDD